MTTLQRYEGIDEIRQTLDAVRSKRSSVRLATSLLTLVAVTAGAALAGALVAGYWPGQPPGIVRWLCLGLVCAAGGGAAIRLLLRAAFGRQNLAQTARFVEGRLPEMHNDLINSVLLAGDASQVSPELVQQAIQEAADHARGVDPAATVPTTSLRRWAAAAVAAVAVLTAFAIAQPGRFNRGILGMVPGKYVGTVNTLELVRLAPGDAKVFAGTSIDIVAEVRNPGGAPLAGRVILRGAEPRPMGASPDYASFLCPLGAAERTIEYAVQIGESRWPQDREFYKIAVVNHVGAETITLRYEYPPYLRLPATAAAKVTDAAVEAPQGSRATVTVRLAEAAPAGRIEIKGQAPQPLAPGADGLTFTVAIPVDNSGGYRLTFLDDSGRVLLRLPESAGGDRAGPAPAGGPAGPLSSARMRMEGYYPITAVADEPPKIELLAPGRDTTAAPGAKVPTKVKASDKYGLTKVELFASKENTPPQLVNVYKLSGRNEEVLDFDMPLEGFARGDAVVYFAAATDNRSLPGLNLGPQTAETAKFKVLLQDPNAAAQEAARRFEEIRKRLLAILKLQEGQRVASEICRRQHRELAQVTAAGARIGAGQKSIKAQMLDLIGNVPFEGDLVTIRQAVALLAQNEAQLAIDQSAVLEKLASMDQRDSACGVLAVTQDRILSVLGDLLAIMPSLASQRVGAERSGAGSDLPPDVREKLKELDENLKKFIEDQRKAIEASKGLAKKPVDTLTAEDEKTLNDLKALQDKWEKFLEEALADFSKLAQQDFSNPQLLKELISVKSDVTMAKDALSQKAVEIATALEDNGIENAKELTANIEKWLPDVADRQQWKMENPTDDTQMKTEQPNLPTELEDLVGDLLEEEEDLFDEMQDQTAKYNMSGDKGIGWDAMDGPISNMNAQGVTGNQLPNSNELSGRSGEGRQGKASGEFVEDKAVGKGGRRTPTRLTPEPFQKGEINDQSSEPAGGSTGGGKLSGSGGEGLEGPVPPPIQKEMQRLAGKQADLISRGRKFLENYKQGDYAGFKLLQTITLLDRVRDDLENNRYQNALRQRPAVMDSLSQTKLALTKDVKVQADTSAAMPKYVKDGLNDAMKGKIPEEYRDVLEEYYRRLSENK